MKKLSKAVTAGDVTRALDLLQHGADPNEEEFLTHVTPMIHAASSGHPAVVRLLLDHGGDVTKTHGLWGSPLHCAGNAETARVLVAAGADVNLACGKHLHTPLHAAAEGGRLEVVLELLESGAAVNPMTDKEETPLDLVAQSLELLSHDDQKHQALRATWSALEAAGGERHHHSFEETTGEQVDRSRLWSATQEGKSDEVFAMLQKPKVVERLSEQGELDLLLGLALAGKVGAMLPVDVGAEAFVEAMAGSRMTEGHVAIAVQLVSLGADVNMRASVALNDPHQLRGGGTPRAVDERGNALWAGKHPFEPSDVGVTPMFFAAMNDSPELVDALAEAGADSSATTSFDQTPLHWAVMFDAHRAAERLIAAGADVSARAVDGAPSTPLAWARSRVALQPHGEKRHRSEALVAMFEAYGATE